MIFLYVNLITVYIIYYENLKGKKKYVSITQILNYFIFSLCINYFYLLFKDVFKLKTKSLKV